MKWIKLSHAFYIFSIGMTTVGLIWLLAAVYLMIERGIT